MKRYLTIIVLTIVFCQNVSSQQAIMMRDLVDIALPEGVEKITTENSAASSRISKSTEFSGKIGDFYEGEGVIIRIITSAAARPADFLEKNKEDTDAQYVSMGLHPNNFSSVISSINNYKAWILTYDEGDKCYFLIYTDSNTHKGALNMVIECPAPSREKFTRVVDRLLNSIKFKE